MQFTYNTHTVTTHTHIASIYVCVWLTMLWLDGCFVTIDRLALCRCFSFTEPRIVSPLFYWWKYWYMILVLHMSKIVMFTSLPTFLLMAAGCFFICSEVWRAAMSNHNLPGLFFSCMQKDQFCWCLCGFYCFHTQLYCSPIICISDKTSLLFCSCVGLNWKRRILSPQQVKNMVFFLFLKLACWNNCW